MQTNFWGNLWNSLTGSNTGDANITYTEQGGTDVGASFRNFWPNLVGDGRASTEKAGLPTAMPGSMGFTPENVGSRETLGAFQPQPSNVNLPLPAAPPNLFRPYDVRTSFSTGVEKPWSATFVGPLGLENRQTSAQQGPTYGPTQPGLVVGGAGEGGTGGKASGPTGPKFTQSEIAQPLIKPTTIPKVDFKTKPSVVVPQGELDQAIGPNTSAENSTGFFNRELSDITKTQQQVIDTRAAQPTNVADLEGSRLAEGFADAKANWQRVQAKVDQFNATVQNVESDVRKTYLGSGATESQIQAEISQRMKDLEPTYNRLNAELKTSQAYLDSTRLDVQERFGAARADAKEAVDRVSQKLDFQTSNMNAAYSLMNGMKDYEIKVDAQKNQQRDDARALVALAISNPAIWERMTPQQVADLAGRAQMEPSMLMGLVDMQKHGVFTAYPVTGATNLPYLFVNKATGQVQSGNIPNFFDLKPTESSASIALRKLAENADPEFLTDYALIINGLNDDFAKAKTIEARKLAAQEAVTALMRAGANPYKDGKVNSANLQMVLSVIPQINAMAGFGAGPVEATAGSYTPPPDLIENTH